MATGDFDQYYSDHPWAGIDKNQRTWYDPLLRARFKEAAVYSQFATFAQNMAGDIRTKTMVITHLYNIHPDFDPMGLRDIWMPAAHIDSGSVEITFSRYGGKVAYMEYDDIITYWRRTRRAGIRAIINGQLGQHMTDVIDFLVRNAFLSGDFKLYAGNASNFATLGTSDKFDLQMFDEIHLGMQYRNVPGALSRTGAPGRTIVAIVSPGVFYDIRNQDDGEFIDIMKYADPGRTLNYEVGTFRNVRLAVTPSATLRNCGSIIKQVNVTSAISAGDGAYSTVDGVYTPGQSGATSYVQCSDFDEGDFQVNDIVTLHVDRTSAHGVTNGVDYTDGKLHNLRVVNVDATNNRLAFDRPIMVDFDTDLGGGVYAYITKARHIHTSIFIGGPNGSIAGVGRPPRLHTPRPVDDFDAVHRFSWDAYIGYNVFRPEVFEVVYSAGTVRVKGNAVVQ